MNLVSTFSRTAIFGCAIAVFVLSLCAGKQYFFGFSFAALTTALIGFSNGKVRAFILNRIFKGSFETSGSVLDQGRAMMYWNEWNYFRNGSFGQKLFGHGYVGNSTSGHNAYLYILNVGGVVMFAFFLIVIIWCLKRSLFVLSIDRMTGALCLGLQALVLLYMVAQTPILFFSSMDAFFITALFVMIPLYVSNSLISAQAVDHKAEIQ
jgi:hypothetical protein